VRSHRRRIAVAVGILFAIVLGLEALFNLFAFGRLLPPAQHTCEFRNEASVPIAVGYRQSVKNTFHTPVVNTRWINPGEKEAFVFSVGDQFIAGAVLEEENILSGFDGPKPADWNPGSYISPQKKASYAILLADNGKPLFKEVDDAQR
jgi:hypothetical protein